MLQEKENAFNERFNLILEEIKGMNTAEVREYINQKQFDFWRIYKNGNVIAQHHPELIPFADIEPHTLPLMDGTKVEVYFQDEEMIGMEYADKSNISHYKSLMYE